MFIERDLFNRGDGLVGQRATPTRQIGAWLATLSALLKLNRPASPLAMIALNLSRLENQGTQEHSIKVSHIKVHSGSISPLSCNLHMLHRKCSAEHLSAKSISQPTEPKHYGNYSSFNSCRVTKLQLPGC